MRASIFLHAVPSAEVGLCDAYVGMGSPYAPFRDIFAMLSADVESQWKISRIDHAHALRLWSTLPLFVKALLARSHELVDVLVNGHILATHAMMPEIDRYLQFNRQAVSSDRIQTQCTNVLQALSRHVPLILILDDLQWADLDSLNLLFHLGRRLAGYRLLIVGTYRPAEVTVRNGEDDHPLLPIVNEFKRRFGDNYIALNCIDDAERRTFIDDLIDVEKNTLDETFRHSLFKLTAGHPLYAIETLRDMQTRGDLVHDECGA